MDKKHIETSKVILIVSAVYGAILTLYAMVAMLVVSDLSPLSYLIPGIFGVISVATGFYYWKARAENVIKLKVEAKKEGVEVDETDFNQADEP